jgi:2-amino-4-hydroxy-6-hydroxymethyldihydropteridine diphosphokinase
MNNKIYLSLGSNMGDRVGHLKAAVSLLEKNSAINISQKSSLYTTAPMGYLEQDDFINAVIEIQSDLDPMGLLKICQETELALKRERIIHWGPRTIDVDILWIDNYTSETEHLHVPHPRMLERAFVMVPLSEINPSLVIENKAVVEWCGELTDQQVRKMIHEEW